MGVVYAAYDPELDRKVAVKLLLSQRGAGSDGEGRARLVREAQALARLAHPNVVAVHDVGTHGDMVWIAMEFVAGRTLGAWGEERARRWPEVLRVLSDVARGVAAAHAAGLVHRDLKPDNVMIDRDDRVRVMDFGLAHGRNIGPKDVGILSTLSGDVSAQPQVDALALRLTEAGVIQGTPAYMAPEQWKGQEAQAATDQFGWSVMAWELLYGERPFVGETTVALAAAVLSGRRRPPRSRGVPSWLRRVVERGLASDPAERWPTMAVLLAALDRGMTRGRVRAATIGATLAIAVVVAGFWATRSRPLEVDPCSGGAAEVAHVWDDRRAAAEQALTAAGPAYAREIWPRIARDLDQYADDWQGIHREACLAHQRGETSGALLDRRMACLGRYKAALGEAVNVLSAADSEVAMHALEVVGDLPTLERCSDLDALAAEVPPPADPQVRAQVDALRPRLARVRTLESAGLAAMALAEAEELQREAEALGEPALLSEVLLQRGRLKIHGHDETDATEALLTRAFLVALAAGLDEVAAEALTLRLYIRGRSDTSSAGSALDDFPLAEALVARLPAPGRLRGLLLNNAGSANWALGEMERGTALFREALAVRERALGPGHLDVAYTLFNLATAPSADHAERSRLIARALAIFDDHLGQAHPQTVQARMDASLYVIDPREARILLAPACEALGRFFPEARAERARCLHYLGHHASEAGDPVAASAAFFEVDDIVLSSEREHRPLSLTVEETEELRGRAALARGRYAAAVERLRLALDDSEGWDEWWLKRYRAELQFQLGLGLQALGHRAEAGKAFRAAVSGFAVAAAKSRSVLVKQRLAVAQVALATHLLEVDISPAVRAEADALVAAAGEFYRRSGPGYAWRLPINAAPAPG